MKKLLVIITGIASIIFFNSCDDEVSPKSDFKDLYVLSCVIRTDTNYQAATVSRSYDIEGYNPLEYTNDPFIKGAKIKVFYNNSVYNFRDTAITRSGDSRFKTPMNIYYVKGLQPQYSLPIRIEAEMPDGKILSAESEIISVLSVFLTTTTSTISTQTSTSKINFSWGELLLAPGSRGVYYAPELVVLYTHEKNGVIEKKQKKVPLYYANLETGVIPIYPQIQSGIKNAGFEMEAVKRAIVEIAEGDPDKSSYKIEKAIFRLLIMDAGLATYYAIQKTFLDEFSVRVNQPDATNIRGGLGVFGTYTIKQLEIQLTPDFIKSLGYN